VLLGLRPLYEFSFRVDEYWYYGCDLGKTSTVLGICKKEKLIMGS
jgi:hypothetical protein